MGTGSSVSSARYAAGAPTDGASRPSFIKRWGGGGGGGCSGGSSGSRGGHRAVDRQRRPADSRAWSSRARSDSGPGSGGGAPDASSAADDAPAAPATTHYFYEGQRFESYDNFLAAVDRRWSEQDADEAAVASSEAMAARVRELFHQYAEGTDEIAASDFEGLAASVAAALGLDPERFRQLNDAFDRFDADGDGGLGEDECVLLAESMRRYYSIVVAPVGRGTLMDIGCKSLSKLYKLRKKLGKGGQGSVHLATERSTGRERVVKIVDKDCANAPVDDISAEFRLLKSLDHPRIQRIYDVFEDRHHVYLVSEPYYGGHLGELVEHAMDEGVYVSAGYLARVLSQVIQGTSYLHSKCITHCDLKEANVMVTSASDWDAPSVVVIDFGFAQTFATRGRACGTPGYMPPEVWTRGLWTPKGDVHALGVVAYQLFSNGTRCFGGWGEEAIKKKTMEEMPDFGQVTRAWPRCRELVPLLQGMLAKDLRRRPSAKECLAHAFFERRPDHARGDDDGISAEAVAVLRSLRAHSALQRAVRRELASAENLSGLKHLNAAFDAMDKDHDGVLTGEEVRAALLRHEVSAEEAQRIAGCLVGPEDLVEYTSFMGELLSEKTVDEGVVLLQAFEELDTGKMGYLDKDHLGLLLKKPALAKIVGGRTAKELLSRMDFDGDGRVLFEEFRRALEGGGPQVAARQPAP